MKMAGIKLGATLLFAGVAFLAIGYDTYAVWTPEDEW